MVKRLTMILAGLFLSIGMAMAQTQVTGTVVSQEDGEPIVGAAVLIEGTNTGTVTDVDGKFTLQVQPGKRLNITYLGMAPQNVAASNNMRVQLASSEKSLNEVVVTAMGIKREQKTLGYAAQTLNSAQLTEGRLNDVTSSLAGKVAGVTINSTSGDPGQANSVLIRGISSINGNNQPLYVVDGVPLSQTAVQGQQHTNSMGGITNVNPNDIASMTVLKGAAATALYGSRAANGVILINTKTGQVNGGRNFSIEYNGGVQARMVSTLPTFQNKYGQGWNGQQTFIENGSWGAEMDGSYQNFGPIWNYSQLGHKYSPVESNVKDFFDTGINSNHTISISGVSNDKKMTYYMSYGYTSDDGIIPSNKDSYSRNTLAYRGSFQPVDWVKLSTSINFANSKTNTVGSFQGASFIDGILEFPRDMSLVDHKDLTSAFNTPEAWLTPYGITNPYWAIENNYNRNNAKQVYGKVQADINPIKNVTLTYRFGFDYTDFDLKMGVPQIALDDANIQDNKGYPPSSMNQSGSVYSRYMRKYELNHDLLVNWTDKFINDRLDVNMNIGMNMNERYQTYMDGETDDLTFYSGFWDLSNGATKQTLLESQNKRRLFGVFGDVTFGWDNMLYLQLTARKDWSSTLPLNKNSFFYPGATLSWIFTELIPKNNILDFGKVRLAYGKTGNDASAYLTSLRFAQAFANGYYGTDIAKFPMNATNSFLAYSIMPSTDLRPEMTTEFETGVNLAFLGNRINVDFSFYNRNTNDQIFTLPVDPSTGYSSKVTNFGKVRNTGIELLINTTPVKVGDFRWDLGFNFAKNKNKVISMPASLEGGKSVIQNFSAGNDAVYAYAEVGKPIGEFYTQLPTYTESGQLIVDSNGQPIIPNDVVDTGKNFNNDWTGGVTTAFTYKGVTLSAALDIRKGGYMFSRTKNLMEFTGNGLITTYNDRRPFIIPNSVVSDDNGGYVANTTPIYMNNSSYQDYFDASGMAKGGEFYLIDRSYVKVRNITLAWSLPKSWVRKTYLSDIALSLFVNNPFVWTASDNLYIDPETSSYGNDIAGQFGELYSNPACRTYGFNLSVKF